MNSEDLSEFLEECTNFPASPGDDIFSILETLESSCDYNNNKYITNYNPAGLVASSGDHEESSESFEFQNSLGNYSPFRQELSETELEAAAAAVNSPKRQKLLNNNCEEGLLQVQKISHITVERNRRKQMNEHLAALRALMPCFYVKRGDQASIIGGVVNYITELQQILQSLESKKQRKAYAEVGVSLSPRVSPRLSPPGLSPRRPSLSPGPRLHQLPISPRTPQPSTPYKPRMHTYLNSPSLPSPADLSPCNSSATSSINDTINELVATSKSVVAEVEVKFSGPNLQLKTASHRIPGQASKIVSVLEELALETLQMNVSTVEETMLYSFTIKIGIDCQLSAEELAEQIQQTFC